MIILIMIFIDCPTPHLSIMQECERQVVHPAYLQERRRRRGGLQHLQLHGRVRILRGAQRVHHRLARPAPHGPHRVSHRVPPQLQQLQAVRFWVGPAARNRGSRSNNIPHTVSHALSHTFSLTFSLAFSLTFSITFPRSVSCPLACTLTFSRPIASPLTYRQA